MTAVRPSARAMSEASDVLPVPGGGATRHGTVSVVRTDLGRGDRAVRPPPTAVGGRTLERQEAATRVDAPRAEPPEDVGGSRPFHGSVREVHRSLRRRQRLRPRGARSSLISSLVIP